MKQPSPLVPQGSFEAQGQRKSHVRIAVFTILAIHVVVLGGLLILGCKREDKNPDANANPMTNDVTEVAPFTNSDLVVAPPLPGAPTNNIPATETPGPAPVPVTTGTPPPPVSPGPAETALTEHTIVKGDTFGSLATKYGVSVKAIQAANPNLQPTRLKIGDKVTIPPKTVAAAQTGTGAVATDAPDIYTVKSGDVLSRIAKAHHTTVTELQKLNNLQTTQIRVGQKLKLPPQPAGATPSPAQ